MASNRIVINRSLLMAQSIGSVVSAGGYFREKLQELASAVGAYNADASFQTDTGMSASDQTKFTALLNNAVAEMSTLTLVAVAQGGQTNVRQLLDQLSTGM